MSAREWYICPFCKKDITKAKEEYGKIPVDKFIEKYKDSLINTEFDEDVDEETETVRMDGEEWLDDDGTYKIDHSMQCNNCSREWSIKVSVKPSEDYNGNLTFKIPSKTKQYEHHEVEYKKGIWSCDCIGFKTRKKCSHIELTKNKYNLKQLEKKEDE